MRFKSLVLVLSIAAMPLAAQNPVPAPTVPVVPEDLKKLNGLWKPQSVVFDETEQMDSKSRDMLTLAIKDGEYRMYYCSNPEKDEHIRLFTADLSVDGTAKTMTLNVKDGQKKGQQMHGIYELKDKQLKLCYGPSEKPRPTKFEAARGSGLFLETWKIEEKK